MFAAVLESCPLPARVPHRMLTIAKDLECAVNKQKMQDSGFHKASTKMNAEEIFTATKKQQQQQQKSTKNKNKNGTNMKPQKGKKEAVEGWATDNLPALNRQPVPKQRKARETSFKLNNYWLTCCE